MCNSVIQGFARRNREKTCDIVRNGKKRNKTSHALMTSLAKNCRGMQCAKFVNKN